MKTKDLIKLLTQYDPKGEKEVLISNNDIDYIVQSAMYESGKGFVITKREDYKQNQPTEITLTLSNEKINLVPIDTFEYYRHKIIDDQEFINITTENNVFYWESSKIVFNKLLSLLYCKEYIGLSDEKIYPYKNELLERIKNEIIHLMSSYNENLYNHCKKINFIEKIKQNLLNIIEKIIELNENIVLGLPQLSDKSINIKTVGIKNFNFEIFNNVIKYTHWGLYDKKFIETTNINIQTFDFKKNIAYSWKNIMDSKIEKMLYN